MVVFLVKRVTSWYFLSQPVIVIVYKSCFLKKEKKKKKGVSMSCLMVGHA